MAKTYNEAAPEDRWALRNGQSCWLTGEDCPCGYALATDGECEWCTAGWTCRRLSSVTKFSAFMCRLFGHYWRPLFCNRYGITTARECPRCGVRQEWHGGIDGAWRTWREGKR
jgi:hypothetical protein